MRRQGRAPPREAGAGAPRPGDEEEGAEEEGEEEEEAQVKRSPLTRPKLRVLARHRGGAS